MSKAEVRQSGAALLLAVSLALGTRVPLLAALAAAAALVMARTSALRSLVGVTAASTFVLPWPGPALAGFVIWLAASRLTGPPAETGGPPAQRVHASGHRAAVVALSATLVGLIAGAVATGVSWRRLAGAPLLVTFHRPSPAVLAAVVILLALVNAFAEECLWRVALFHEESRLAAPLYVSQGLSFGVAHYAGIPSGWLGMILAGLFSVLLLLLRRGWGFGAALLAHFGADLVIFGAVLALATYPPT